MRPTIYPILAAALSGCVIIADSDATLTIHNHSDQVLVEVHLAERSDDWGPNLLPSALYPGEDLVIDDIECGEYDVLVIDENGIDCELRDLHLCFSDEGWVIDNVTLWTCIFDR
jgi:hypothetical protein